MHALLRDILEAIKAQTKAMGEHDHAMSLQMSKASTQLAEAFQTLSDSVQALAEASRQSSSMTDSRGPFWEPLGHWTAEIRFRPTGGADSVGHGRRHKM